MECAACTRAIERICSRHTARQTSSGSARAWYDGRAVCRCGEAASKTKPTAHDRTRRLSPSHRSIAHRCRDFFLFLSTRRELQLRSSHVPLCQCHTIPFSYLFVSPYIRVQYNRKITSKCAAKL